MQEDDVVACYCDEACGITDDCCDDYAVQCIKSFLPLPSMNDHPIQSVWGMIEKLVNEYSPMPLPADVPVENGVGVR